MSPIDTEIRKKCEQLKSESVDFEDAKQYLEEVVTDIVDKFPDKDEQYIKNKSLEILQSLYRSE